MNSLQRLPTYHTNICIFNYSTNCMHKHFNSELTYFFSLFPLSLQVTSAAQFLLSHCPQSPQLHALPLRQYIEDGVYHAFSDPFYHDMSKRRKCGLPSQDPAVIIDLYNNAVAYLAKVVSSSKLVELSWPVTEFTSLRGSFVMPPMDWNSLEHLAWLKKAVLSFQIPEMDKPPEQGEQFTLRSKFPSMLHAG